MLTPNLGTLGFRPYLSVSGIPAIITEWSALFPLVSHLANYGEDDRLVGELALEGHLTVELFPKLGYLDGLRRLLQLGPEFLDRANANSASTYKVWDVNWGNVFTRANGSANSIITEYALRKQPKVIQMPEETSIKSKILPGVAPAVSTVPIPQPQVAAKAAFRRYQKLHIVRMSRINHNRTVRGTLLLILLSRAGKAVYHFILIGLVVVLCLIGAFGSAAVVLNGLISKVMCRILRVKRPSGYLESNENHDACMLSAVHENAETWYLYMGDRGVIDWMLNKTMLTTPSASRLQIFYFRLAHLMQLLAMTFVAAQKGIDGVSLIILLVSNHALQYLFGGHRIARQWLEAEKVSVDAHTFRFSGRTPMIGVIHSFSQARDATWMESVMAPCPRVNVWLTELKRPADMQGRLNIDRQGLSSSDCEWVLLNTQLTLQAETLIRKELSQGKATESLYVKGKH
ncbi:hypothetical protein IMSHALPRED_004725 [Imshaugia aleurites]|uniref:Uncharacterized protein n=1 Tax=Imshaugia aleurites TaxID=172621 RepID=A0A8H3J8T3_9LECA|nr:hypothetical protein IMSHALPRED_004725 [Imshaugia aleurites]